MRQNIRDLDHVGPFVEKLKVATASRQTLLHGLVDDVTFVREHLSASAVTLMAQLEMYPTTIDGVGQSIQWRWRPHSCATKVRSIEVLLSRDDTSSERRSQKMLSLRNRENRVALLSPVMGKRKAAHFSKGLDKFLVDADRAARWASAGGRPVLLNQGGLRSGLNNWIDGIGDACELSAKTIAGVIERFLNLDAELNDLIFEFNEARQPVRFHSIICRREVRASDPLSPAEPRFRVVEFYDRRTGRRSSRDVQSYKQKMAVARISAELRKHLEREPTKAEVDTVLANRRMRKPNATITAELISHCKLGKHSAGIHRLQKKIADVMGQWEASRAFLQALL